MASNAIVVYASKAAAGAIYSSKICHRFRPDRLTWLGPVSRGHRQPARATGDLLALPRGPGTRLPLWAEQHVDPQPAGNGCLSLLDQRKATPAFWFMCGSSEL